MSYTPYATRADLVTYSLPAAALTGVSTVKQDAALVAASQRADAYLNAIYKLPLTVWGEDIKQAVCDIAALIVMKGRGFSPESADAQMFLTGSRDAIKWFEGISTGKWKPLGVTDSSSSTANTGDTSSAGHGPFVAQLQEAEVEQDEFWTGTSASQGATVGTPKRRGW